MKFKLVGGHGLSKYDLYQIGNVIVTEVGDCYMVICGDAEIAGVTYGPVYSLVNLKTGELSRKFHSIKALAEYYWEPEDRLMVNPTLVEEGTR